MHDDDNRVKFETVFLDDEAGLGKLECHRRTYLPKFRRVCADFEKRGWFPKRSGNLSVVIDGDEMLVTASNIEKSRLKKDDLILVERFDLSDRKVWAYGSKKPSSEAFMHHMIYQNHAARAVIHAHVDEIVKSEKLSDLRTPLFFDEGTIELADAVSEKLRETGDVAILRDHGVIAHASSLDLAAEKIIKLLARA